MKQIQQAWKAVFGAAVAAIALYAQASGVDLGANTKTAVGKAVDAAVGALLVGIFVFLKRNEPKP